MAFGKKNKGQGEGEQENGGAAGSARDADFSVLDDEQHPSASEAVSMADEGQAADDGQLSHEIEQLKTALTDEQDKHLRLLAEFDNFRKRALKERSDLLKYQGERIFVDVLDIVDNLELALQHAEADPAKLKSGVELIYKMFTDMLAKWEVRPEPGIGKAFDPNRHNAISRAETRDADPGTIISELKKAYFYKDKLLRLGEVVVANAPVDEDGGELDRVEPES